MSLYGSYCIIMPFLDANKIRSYFRFFYFLVRPKLTLELCPNFRFSHICMYLAMSNWCSITHSAFIPKLVQSVSICAYFKFRRICMLIFSSCSCELGVIHDRARASSSSRLRAFGTCFLRFGGSPRRPIDRGSIPPPPRVGRAWRSR